VFSLANQVLMTAALIVAVGLFALVRERGSRTGVAFFGVTLAAGVWFFCLSRVYLAADYDVALRWAKASYLGIALLPIVVFHLSVLIENKTRRLGWKGMLVWVGSLASLAAILTTNLVFGSLRRYAWGYYPKFERGSVLFLVFFVAVLADVLRRLWAAYRGMPVASTRRKRTRALFIAFAVGSGALVDFAGAFGFPLYPFGWVFILFFTIQCAHTITRYRLVDITPAFAARQIIDTMSDALLLLDREGVVRVANRAACVLFGFGEDVLVGMPASRVVPGGDPLLRELESPGGPDGVRSLETPHVTPQGERRMLDLTASTLRAKSGEPLALVCVARDITDRLRSEQEIRHLAYYDGLTGLPNRTFCKELIARAAVQAKRHGSVMAVLFIDLDEFKRVNDTLGHASGDQLLSAVAAAISRCTRKSDTLSRPGEEDARSAVSRLGGDEFVVLLSEIALGEDALVVARRILSALSLPVSLGVQEVFISASIGVSLYPLDGEDAETLLKHADMAMYEAKRRGRNGVQFFAQSMNALAMQRMTLESELHKAIEREEFVLYYQPIIDVRSAAMVGVEALVRWKHPERGIVPPGEFIPLAEQSGLIVPIGEWVLRMACMQGGEWQRAGMGPLRIAVNLSSRQLDQQGLVDTVALAIRSSGIDPRSLELEITESAIMANEEKAAATLRRLREMGARASIDDFGTGYSSLAQLRLFSVDTLKIDRSFIKGIASNGDDLAIATAIIAMAHSLKLGVIAEGVETECQHALLRRLGCDEAQGFLFGRPVPAREILRAPQARSLASTPDTD
jgi:diguanylate cyclase (GGDEF)-like protein/PAS domain S-box-containing protein